MNILIAGEGGQGVQTIAETLAYAASLSGLHSSYLPQFGVEQRGTPSVAYVQISNEPIFGFHFKFADITVVLRERAIEKIKESINPHTLVIFDSSTIDKSKLPTHFKELLGIPATKLALEKIQPKVFNVIVLGAMSKLIFNLEKKYLWQALEFYLGKKFLKNQLLKEQNIQALDLGYDIIFERSNCSKPIFKTHKDKIVDSSDGKISTVYPSLCKGCKICVLKCPVKAISMSRDIGFFGNPVPKVDNKKCILCDNCSVFCPDTAIQVKAEKS